MPSRSRRVLYNNFKTVGDYDFKKYYLALRMIGKCYFPKPVSYNRFVELTPLVIVPLCLYLDSRKGNITGISLVCGLIAYTWQEKKPRIKLCRIDNKAISGCPCHSPGREEKENAILKKFYMRYEAGLNGISDGLKKPKGEKRFSVPMERIGRLNIYIPWLAPPAWFLDPLAFLLLGSSWQSFSVIASMATTHSGDQLLHSLYPLRDPEYEPGCHPLCDPACDDDPATDPCPLPRSVCLILSGN